MSEESAREDRRLQLPHEVRFCGAVPAHREVRTQVCRGITKVVLLCEGGVSWMFRGGERVLKVEGKLNECFAHHAIGVGR